MTKISLPELLKTQISLSEWFKRIGHEKTEAFRHEDSTRAERMQIVNEILDIPYDEVYSFPATVLDTPTKEFSELVERQGDMLCGFRLIPSDVSHEKLRMRGKSLREAIEWAREQPIDLNAYEINVLKHSDNGVYSTIFVVNNNGIFGEIIPGLHFQLTQGFSEQELSTPFIYDFNTLYIDQSKAYLIDYLLKIFAMIKVDNFEKQQALADRLSVSFTNNYINGYFETIETVEHGLWFLDMNRVLGEYYKDFSLPIPGDGGAGVALKGPVASQGLASGRVRIIVGDNFDTVQLDEGDILVCPMTTPNHIMLMQQAAAIVTDLGGILSHAAIISRELG